MIREGSKPLLSERTAPGRVFDVHEGDNVLEIFADGTARVMLGVEVSKIEFTRSNGPKDEGPLQVDQRELFARVSMPTSALIEFCAITLENFGKHVALLQTASSTNQLAIKEAIKRVSALKL